MTDPSRKTKASKEQSHESSHSDPEEKVVTERGAPPPTFVEVCAVGKYNSSDTLKARNDHEYYELTVNVQTHQLVDHQYPLVLVVRKGFGNSNLVSLHLLS